MSGLRSFRSVLFGCGFLPHGVPRCYASPGPSGDPLFLSRVSYLRVSDTGCTVELQLNRPVLRPGSLHLSALPG